MKKGILIDMGDTIVHNLGMSFKRALEHVYELNKNKKVSKTKYLKDSLQIINDCFKTRTIIEVRAIDFLRLISETFNLEFDKPLEEVEIEFANSFSKIERVKNIEELLIYFKEKGYPIVVLSNTCFSNKTIRLMLGDLNKYFDDVIVSSEYMARKPYKAFFDLGLSKFKGVNKRDIYYIGNSFYNDVYGANNASIYPIWFNEKKEKKPDNLNVNDYIEITNYNQLIEMDF